MYVSGIEAEFDKLSSDHSFTDKDIESVKNTCIRGQTNFRGVDILITSSWPKDIMLGDKSCSVSHVPLMLPFMTIIITPHFTASSLTCQPSYSEQKRNCVVPVADTDRTKWIMVVVLVGCSSETSLPFLWPGRSLF